MNYKTVSLPVTQEAEESNFTKSIAQPAPQRQGSLLPNCVSPEESELGRRETRKLKTITAQELMKKEFPPIKWIIPSLLPEGLTILSGSPKIGKSWMALSICRAVAHGGYCLNSERVQQGAALYLALEDGERRLQDRLKQVGGSIPESSDFHLSTLDELPTLDSGGMDMLKGWLDEHPKCRIVIIDTFQRVRPNSKSSNPSYADDYSTMILLQALATKLGISLVVIHHNRKLGSDTPSDKVSGTTGLTGGADNLWVLERPYNKPEGKLSITGRDIEEQELALKFDSTDCRWSIIGKASEVASSREEKEVLDFAYAQGGPFSIQDLAEELEIQKDAARKRLNRMSQTGKIKALGRGSFIHPAFTGKCDNVTPRDNKGVTSESNVRSLFQPQRDIVTPNVPIQSPDANSLECHIVTKGDKPLSPKVSNCDTLDCHVVTKSEDSSLSRTIDVRLHDELSEGSV